ncbi:MAG: NusG domain II-containing protein [Clostridia bacterium]|nr:NusG domain II-containing protein [Clostridia bacterium]
MFKVIKKADIILFFVLVILSSIITAVAFGGAEKGSTVEVTVDGKLYGTYSLDKDQTIEIKQDKATNKITIKDGQVQMSDSTCKNQICVEAGAICETNQSIVCLPNKVMIEIVGGEGGFDAVAN